jgi:hypothetical protein
MSHVHHPHHRRAQLERTRMKLMKTRSDTKKLFAEIEEQLEGSFKRYETASEAIDFAAGITVGGIGGLAKGAAEGTIAAGAKQVGAKQLSQQAAEALAKENAEGLVGILKKGFDYMKATTDAELEEINKEIGTIAGKLIQDPLEDEALKALGNKLGEFRNVVTVVGADAIGSFLDMTSLTFWTRIGSEILGEGKSWSDAVRAAHDPREEAMQRIARSKQLALQQLDKRIEAIDKLLGDKHPQHQHHPPTSMTRGELTHGQFKHPGLL